MQIPENIKKHFPLFCTILFFIFVNFAFIHPISGNDLWFHLRIGQDIWESKSIPRQDYHSFTAPGATYINQSWLAQLIFFSIYKISGFTGLQILHTLLISLTFLFLILISRPKNIHLAIFLIALLFPLTLNLDEIRPYYFTWFFLSLETYLIYKKKFSLIPFIFIFWANLHAGFLLGIGLLFFHCLKNYLSFKKPYFILIFGLSLLATFINPYGPRIYLYSSGQGRYPELLSVNEWLPFTINSISFWAYFIYVLTLIIVCIKQKLYKKNLLELIFIIVISIFGYSSRRHSFIIIMILLPFYLQYLGPFFQKFKTILYITACVFPIFLFFYKQTYISLIHFNQIDDVIIPYYGVKFLLDHQINGRVFNDYGFGGYFLWANPTEKVFIDGRQDPYYGQPTLEFMAVISTSPVWEDILNKYQINYIILRPNKKLNNILLSHPDWDLVYFDSVSTIYLRHGTFPQIPRLNNITPNIYRKPQDTNSIIAEYQYLISQNPKFCAAYQSIANIYLEQGNFNLTQNYLQQLINNCPFWKNNPDISKMKTFLKDNQTLFL